MSKKFEMNMICADGKEVRKQFLIKKYTDKFLFYRERQKFIANTQHDPFGALLVLVNATFEECVTGIEIDGFTDGNYSAKINEFFINDPEALDILAKEVINFQSPPIKR